MSVNISFPIDIHFKNGIKSNVLFKNFLEKSSLPIVGIAGRKETVEACFSRELTEEELTEVSNIVAAYDPAEVIQRKDKPGAFKSFASAPNAEAGKSAVVGSMRFDSSKGDLYFCVAVKPEVVWKKVAWQE